MFHQLYEKSYYIQHLGILLWHASVFHYEYVSRQVTLEADIPLQQLSTHLMSNSWMKICYSKKVNQHCLHDIKYICVFAESSLVIFEQLLVKLWQTLIHVYFEEIFLLCVTQYIKNICHVTKVTVPLRSVDGN